jgi:Ca2+-binding RTX toxin-like protein
MVRWSLALLAVGSVAVGVAMIASANNSFLNVHNWRLAGYGPQPHKVTLCHQGHEISVDEDAVPAHLAQGDTVGPCPAYVPEKGSAGNDHIVIKGDKPTSIYDPKGNNTIHGNNADDKIRTGSGDDKIYTGNGNNKVVSGGGADVIHAGKGHNTIFSGPGNDVIYVRNGMSDFVNCGPGVDTVYADGTKLDTVKGCEHVHRGTAKR